MALLGWQYDRPLKCCAATRGLWSKAPNVGGSVVATVVAGFLSAAMLAVVAVGLLAFAAVRTHGYMAEQQAKHANAPGAKREDQG
ncbi:hypothetical protein V5R04_08895 [Jonesiaceae bacterium BS-20]|uniref:Uncharacterized protein n=1 Tax=Jonesiaceae bacterium BS-20 TaxID=3120821 RepID=A0AAU7DSU7_9MICO